MTCCTARLKARPDTNLLRADLAILNI